MRVKSLRDDLLKYIRKHGLTKKLSKQIGLFCLNPRHPSLHTELLEPRSLRIFSFRLDSKYRVVFIFSAADEVEIVDINDHYA